MSKTATAPAVTFTVEDWPLDRFIPYARNARQIPESAIAKVAASIKEFGWQQPIVVDPEGVILAGHTRLLAAKKLGETTAPAKIAHGLTEAQAKAFRLMDNQSHEEATWDDRLLALELEELRTSFDFDMTLTGFDMSEIEMIGLEGLEQTEAAEDEFDIDEAVAEASKHPRVMPGDVWTLGRHRMLCGDATVSANVEVLMAGEKAHCVLTDPPYNVEYVGKTKDKLTIKNDSFASAKAFHQFLFDAFAGMLGVTREGGSIYVAHADSEGYNFRGALEQSGWMLKQCLVWVKDVFVMGRQDYQWQHEPILYGWKPGAAHRWYSDRSQTTVLNFDRPRRSLEHPIMKPVTLVGYCLANSSRRGDVVLDVFGASGTTLIACEQMHRSARLLELDPVYCDVILTRFEKLTGQVPVKL